MKFTRFITCILIVLMLCCVTVGAHAASVTYDGNAKDFVFSPGTEYSPTDLFENFKNVMPGDTLMQKIVIKNDAAENTDVKIYLRSLGAADGSEDVLSQMKLTVLNGSEELFDAPADKTAQLSDWVLLGTFKAGAEITLDVALEVPIEADNSIAGELAYLEWEFKAEELPIEEEDPDDPTEPEDPSDPPKTGDESNLMMWIILAGVAVVLVAVLMIVLKKKQNKAE